MSSELQENFIDWKTGLPILGCLTFSRCFFDSTIDQIECEYLVAVLETSLVQLLSCAVAPSLHTKSIIFSVFGKTRLAPMKSLSTTKLELQAALLVNRLRFENDQEIIDIKYQKIIQVG